jgi:type 1 glutamine amidotransferase
MRRIALVLSLLTLAATGARAADPWLTFAGKEGPGKGKHVVIVTGDDEYRSEEAGPMLAKLLAERHGFTCSVLFAINPADGTIEPTFQTNIPGTHLLDNADLMIMFLRCRNLPDEQMKPIIDFVEAGKPVIALRTSTHAFNYPGDSKSPYAKYSWTSKDPAGGFGQLVLGDTWVSHHGDHGMQSTRGIINEAEAGHPILKGVTDIWGPSDVYGIVHLPDDAQVLVYGQILEGMKPTDKPIAGPKNDPMMPLVWTRDHKADSGNTARIVTTTMGASVDLESEGLRRLLVNAAYWLTGLGDQIPDEANVDYVGEYNPSFFGFGTHTKGVKPEDLR